MRKIGGVTGITTDRFRKDAKKQRGIFANASDLLQFREISFKDPTEGAKMTDQAMGDLLGILSGNDIKEQQLQNLMIFQESIVFKFFSQSFTVSRV